MPKHDDCRECELSIAEFKQITQEDIDVLKEHINVKGVCECCLLSALGQIEFPD